VAFNGWDSVRLALTYIYLDDFLKQRWNWSKPVLISRPGVIDKSGCLLPEKVNGKYVFFHRIFPNILIDYVDNLSFAGKDRYLKGQYQIKVREDMWDSRKIGAGAPPIKTESGWLLIYYGVDDRDASKYHIGAMLLDYNRPEKVLYRTNQPILMPTKDYENTGFKPGIAYPCGAVKVKDQLLVYYGAADSVVCVATANINTFLNELKSNQIIHMHSIKIKEVSYQP
jgi:beta-1,2-mannobiose phosphorylase / 1,2-beta-oligomannan phosphorylase